MIIGLLINMQQSKGLIMKYANFYAIFYIILNKNAFN